MVTFEVTLPDRNDSDIDRLVEQGDYLRQEQAIEELLSLGVSSNGAADESKEELTNDIFIQAVNDQQDPASQRDDRL